MATNPVIIEKIVDEVNPAVFNYSISYDSTSTAQETWTTAMITDRRTKIATNIANFEAAIAELEAEDARLVEFQAAITAYDA